MGKAVRLLALRGTAVLLASVVVLVAAIDSVRPTAAATERPNIDYAERDDDKLRGVGVPRTLTFNEDYVSHKPAYLRNVFLHIRDRW